MTLALFDTAANNSLLRAYQGNFWIRTQTILVADINWEPGGHTAKEQVTRFTIGTFTHEYWRSGCSRYVLVEVPFCVCDALGRVGSIRVNHFEPDHGGILLELLRLRVDLKLYVVGWKGSWEEDTFTFRIMVEGFVFDLDSVSQIGFGTDHNFKGHVARCCSGLRFGGNNLVVVAVFELDHETHQFMYSNYICP